MYRDPLRPYMDLLTALYKLFFKMYVHKSHFTSLSIRVCTQMPVPVLRIVYYIWR